MRRLIQSKNFHSYQTLLICFDIRPASLVLYYNLSEIFPILKMTEKWKVFNVQIYWKRKVECLNDTKKSTLFAISWECLWWFLGNRSKQSRNRAYRPQKNRLVGIYWDRSIAMSSVHSRRPPRRSGSFPKNILVLTALYLIHVEFFLKICSKSCQAIFYLAKILTVSV